jgi:Major intrinsic protein
MANGPKLNGPFVPLAVGAYIMAWGTMGGPFERASMNPARSFGPDLARGDLTTWWVYVLGPAAGAIFAVIVARILRGPALARAFKAHFYRWCGKYPIRTLGRFGCGAIGIARWCRELRSF